MIVVLSLFLDSLLGSVPVMDRSYSYWYFLFHGLEIVLELASRWLSVPLSFVGRRARLPVAF